MFSCDPIYTKYAKRLCDQIVSFQRVPFWIQISVATVDIFLSFCIMMPSIRSSCGEGLCPYHGVGSCRLAAVNWKVCRSDSDFGGALQSWQDMARYTAELSRSMDFIDQLFRYGGGPIIWLAHESREMAPLYLVSHHGRGIARHACHQQWGCLYCGAATNQLRHAHWNYDECLAARREALDFLRPMLNLLPSFRKFAEGDPMAMSRLLGASSRGLRPCVRRERRPGRARLG